MPLIPDLPAAGSLSASDLLIKDTGSTTQKLLVSNAYASATAPGFVSTGTQTFAGSKTFNSIITINAPTSSGAGFKLRFSDKNDGLYAGIYGLFGGGSPYISIRQFSVDSNGDALGYYDNYRLPTATVGKTENSNYDILTTKTIGLTSALYYGIPNGDSHTFNLPNGSHGVLFTTGAMGGSRGMHIFNVTSAGTIGLTPVLAPSNVTYTTSTNSLTVTNSSGAVVYPMFLLFSGTVSA